MGIIVTGFALLDQPHREIDRCLVELGAAVRARDPRDARGRSCLLGETLSEHFAVEERMMSQGGWSRLDHHAGCHRQILAEVRHLEHLVVRRGLTHELATLAMKHLPEMLRFHQMASDFGFGKFVLGVAEDPGRPILLRASSPRRRCACGRTRAT